MHLVENFALAAGVKIGRPSIEPLYFPIGGDYITIHNSSGMESKNYSYYKDVIQIIKPHLRNTVIVQLGQEGEEVLPHTLNLLGKTNLRQAAYLIMNSKLHIGNDSFACHIAGAYDTPLVGLYGPAHKNTCAPFWGKKETQTILSPDYSNRKPSWSAREPKKRVNEIFPDKVAMHALNLLKIENNLNSITPIHLGDFYGRSIIDIVPNFTGDIGIHKNSIVNIRLDYGGSGEGAEYWLKRYPCTVFINNPQQIKTLEKHKQNLKRVTVKLNEDFTEEDMERIDFLNCKTIIHYEDKETISDIRIKFFGLNIINIEPGSKKDLDFPDRICNNSCYKSSLSLFSKGKLYPCKAALDLNKETSTTQTIIDSSKFYQESKYFKIYNHAT